MQPVSMEFFSNQPTLVGKSRDLLVARRRWTRRPAGLAFPSAVARWRDSRGGDGEEEEGVVEVAAHATGVFM